MGLLGGMGTGFFLLKRMLSGGQFGNRVETRTHECALRIRTGAIPIGDHVNAIISFSNILYIRLMHNFHTTKILFITSIYALISIIGCETPLT